MTRLVRAVQALDPEQRLAAIAALALVLSMLLPWYSKTDTIIVGNSVKATQTSLSGISAMSFVEAAVLLVSVGVLALLFARGEHREFHMPGSDGAVVLAAGAWTAALIFFRLIDKPSLSGTQRITATVGLQWGIFLALAAACLLAYAGQRMRAATPPEPPLLRRRPRRQSDPSQDVTALVQHAPRGPRATPIPARPASAAAPPLESPAGEHAEPHQPSPPPPSQSRPQRATPTVSGDTLAERGPRQPRKRPRYPPAPSDQLSFDDAPRERD